MFGFNRFQTIQSLFQNRHLTKASQHRYQICTWYVSLSQELMAALFQEGMLT